MAKNYVNYEHIQKNGEDEQILELNLPIIYEPFPKPKLVPIKVESS